LGADDAWANVFRVTNDFLLTAPDRLLQELAAVIGLPWS